MGFNYNQALSDGHSDESITSFLGFDYGGAIKVGYTEDEINSFLDGRKQASPPPAPVATIPVQPTATTAPVSAATTSPSPRAGIQPVGIDEPQPELSFGRVLSQIGRSMGQGVADISRGLRAVEEQRGVSATAASPYVQELEEMGETDIFPDDIETATTEQKIAYLTAEKTRNIKAYKAFEAKLPELLPGTSGRLESALAGMARFLPSMGISAVSPMAGAAMTYTQIMGMKYDEFERQGIDPDRAFMSASMSSLAQTPIEMAGNLLQIGAMKNMAKTYLKGKGGKAAAFIEMVFKGIVGEGGEEYLQQWPDEISNMYAKHPEWSAEKLANSVIQNWREINAQAVEASKVGALGGALLAGGAGIVTAPLQIGKKPPDGGDGPVDLLKTPDETKIDDEIKALLAEQEEAEPPGAPPADERVGITPPIAAPAGTLAEEQQAALDQIESDEEALIREEEAAPQTGVDRVGIAAEERQADIGREFQGEQIREDFAAQPRTVEAEVSAEQQAREEKIIKERLGVPEETDLTIPPEWREEIRRQEAEEKKPKGITVPESEQKRKAKDAVYWKKVRKDLNLDFEEEDAEMLREAGLSPRKAAIEATADKIDEGANEAATSPINDKPEPTQKEAEAGDYEKGPIVVQGMNISIENPKGSVRKGTDPSGKKWEVTMKYHYGFHDRTEGKDGDEIDVFVGEDPDSQKAFIIDQVDPETGEFDEHKPMLAFKNIRDARKAYLSNYEKDWKGLGAITEVPIDEYREWIGDGTRKIEAYSDELKTKEPWEMSAEEWFDYKFNKLPQKVQKQIKSSEKGFASVEQVREQTNGEHRRNIQKAIKEGKIKSHPDYPELEKPKTEIPEAPKEEGTVGKLLLQIPKDLKIDIKSVSEETGQILKDKENAREAFKRITAQKKSYTALEKCLKTGKI